MTTANTGRLSSAVYVVRPSDAGIGARVSSPYRDAFLMNAIRR
jgi:hypothetical protein